MIIFRELVACLVVSGGSLKGVLAKLCFFFFMGEVVHAIFYCHGAFQTVVVCVKQNKCFVITKVKITSVSLSNSLKFKSLLKIIKKLSFINDR